MRIIQRPSTLTNHMINYQGVSTNSLSAVARRISQSHHYATALSIVFSVEGLLSEFLEGNVAAHTELANDVADFDVKIVARQLGRGGRLLGYWY